MLKNKKKFLCGIVTSGFLLVSAPVSASANKTAQLAALAGAGAMGIGFASDWYANNQKTGAEKIIKHLQDLQSALANGALNVRSLAGFEALMSKLTADEKNAFELEASNLPECKKYIDKLIVRYQAKLAELAGSGTIMKSAYDYITKPFMAIRSGASKDYMPVAKMGLALVAGCSMLYWDPAGKLWNAWNGGQAGSQGNGGANGANGNGANGGAGQAGNGQGNGGAQVNPGQGNNGAQVGNGQNGNGQNNGNAQANPAVNPGQGNAAVNQGQRNGGAPVGNEFVNGKRIVERVRRDAAGFATVYVNAVQGYVQGVPCLHNDSVRTLRQKIALAVNIPFHRVAVMVGDRELGNLVELGSLEDGIERIRVVLKDEINEGPAPRGAQPAANVVRPEQPNEPVVAGGERGNGGVNLDTDTPPPLVPAPAVVNPGRNGGVHVRPGRRVRFADEPVRRRDGHVQDGSDADSDDDDALRNAQPVQPVVVQEPAQPDLGGQGNGAGAPVVEPVVDPAVNNNGEAGVPAANNDHNVVNGGVGAPVVNQEPNGMNGNAGAPVVEPVVVPVVNQGQDRPADNGQGNGGAGVPVVDVVGNEADLEAQAIALSLEVNNGDNRHEGENRHEVNGANQNVVQEPVVLGAPVNGGGQQPESEVERIRRERLARLGLGAGRANGVVDVPNAQEPNQAQAQEGNQPVAQVPAQGQNQPQLNSTQRQMRAHWEAVADNAAVNDVANGAVLQNGAAAQNAEQEVQVRENDGNAGAPVVEPVVNQDQNGEVNNGQNNGEAGVPAANNDQNAVNGGVGVPVVNQEPNGVNDTADIAGAPVEERNHAPDNAAVNDAANGAALQNGAAAQNAGQERQQENIASGAQQDILVAASGVRAGQRVGAKPNTDRTPGYRATDFWSELPGFRVLYDVGRIANEGIAGAPCADGYENNVADDVDDFKSASGSLAELQDDDGSEVIANEDGAENASIASENDGDDFMSLANEDDVALDGDDAMNLDSDDDVENVVVELDHAQCFHPHICVAQPHEFFGNGLQGA